jgi:hypothetical protein
MLRTVHNISTIYNAGAQRCDIEHFLRMENLTMATDKKKSTIENINSDLPLAITATSQAGGAAAAPANVADVLPETPVVYHGKKPGTTVKSLSKQELEQRSLKQILAVCPIHNTACECTSTQGIFTHLGCPVLGCKFTSKVVRPTTAQKLNKLPAPQRDISRGVIQS